MVAQFGFEETYPNLLFAKDGGDIRYRRYPSLGNRWSL